MDDDSRDSTARVVRQLALTHPHIRVVQRIGRRSLSSACIEGALASAAFIAVMDAGRCTMNGYSPRMFGRVCAAARSRSSLEAVSRRAAMSAISRPCRSQISRIGTRLARLIVKQDLADPMSGFFMLRRDVFERVVRRLSAKGFWKILLDIFASGAAAPQDWSSFPLPLARASRAKASSTPWCSGNTACCSWTSSWAAMCRCAALMFLAVGTIGLGHPFRHFVLLLLDPDLCRSKKLSQSPMAAIVAMVFNYWLNNIITYRDQRLKGVRRVSSMASSASP